MKRGNANPVTNALRAKLLLVGTLVVLGCAGQDPCRPQYSNDLRLEPVYRGELRYPSHATGVRGEVSLHVQVSRSGSVSSATPVASEPPGVFEQAATDYVSKWRYCPRSREDLDFPKAMLVKVEFRPAS